MNPSYAELQELLAEVVEKSPLLKDLLLNDMSDDPYGVSMSRLASIMLAMHAIKDSEYGKSWAKRGEMGVFHNLTRKSDRLEQLAIVSMFGKAMSRYVRVALVDVLMDCATYCLMWVAYIARIKPDGFKAWLQDVWCKTTEVSFDEVVDFLELD